MAVVEARRPIAIVRLSCKPERPSIDYRKSVEVVSKNLPAATTHAESKACSPPALDLLSPYLGYRPDLRNMDIRSPMP